jgi:hypothetical protein
LKNPIKISQTVSTTNKEIMDLYNTANKVDKLKNDPNDEIDLKVANKIENLIIQDLGGNVEEEKLITRQSPKTKDTINEIDYLNPLKQHLDTNSLNRTESDQSIASTLTNSSQITTNKSKHKEEEVEEELPEWLAQNVLVIVSTNTVMNKPGIVRYIGATKFAGGTWIGVELEQAFGKNDGSIKGKSYFKCEENKGVFVRADKLTLVKQN